MKREIFWKGSLSAERPAVMFVKQPNSTPNNIYANKSFDGHDLNDTQLNSGA